MPRTPAHRASKADREKARSDAAWAAKDASTNLRLIQGDIGAAIGVGQSHISKVESQTDSKLYTIADLRLMVEHGQEELAAELLRWVLEPASAHTLTSREQADTKSIIGLARECDREHRDVTDALLEAIEDDGEVDSSEARAVIREAEQDIDVKRRVIGTMRQIIAGQVKGVA